MVMALLPNLHGKFIFLFSLCFASASMAALPDFSSQENFEKTCLAMQKPASELISNQERQAYVVCQDVALAKNIIMFAEQFAKDGKSANTLPPAGRINTLLQGQLTFVRNELRTIRDVLGQIQLKKNQGLWLAPGTWRVDWNGDGTVDESEANFQANSTAQQEQGQPAKKPANEKIRLQQSDILLWLASHELAEATVEILLAYQLNDTQWTRQTLELRDAAAMQRAGNLLTRALKTSQAVRRTTLLETGKAPVKKSKRKQKNTAFPLPLDAQAWEAWDAVVGHLIPLFEGKTVLVWEPKAGSSPSESFEWCPPGKGLLVSNFFQNPPRYPFALAESAERSKMLAVLCQPVGQGRAASGLFSWVDKQNQSMKNTAEGMAQALKGVVSGAMGAAEQPSQVIPKTKR